MTFDIRLLFGWGIVIYAIVFLVVNIFSIYGIAHSYTARGVALGVLIVMCLIAGRSLHAHAWNDVLPYSLSWSFIVLLLDIVLHIPFAQWSALVDWKVWAGYLIVACVPLITPYLSHNVPQRRMAKRTLSRV